MAITTHAELVTAVGNWLHRADLAAVIPDFITLAEARLNRALRLRAMEQTQTGGMAASIALPAGFLAVRSLAWVSGGRKFPLQSVTAGEAQAVPAGGAPFGYLVSGTTLTTVPATSSGSYELLYYKSFDALGAGPNWLIQNAPDAYLYGALLQAAPYLGEDERIAVWAQGYADALAALEAADAQARFGGPLCIRTDAEV